MKLKDLFPVVLERYIENGDCTWTPVDIEIYEGNDNDVFQVFDQNTGRHTKVIGKNAAFLKREEFINTYRNDCNELSIEDIERLING